MYVVPAARTCAGDIAEDLALVSSYRAHAGLSQGMVGSARSQRRSRSSLEHARPCTPFPAMKDNREGKNMPKWGDSYGDSLFSDAELSNIFTR
jgi:hypothetical protein